MAKHKKQSIVYALREHQFGKIIYVGITNDLNHRIWQHRKEGIIEFGFVTILDEDNERWRIREKELYWINWAIKHDQPIKNVIYPFYLRLKRDTEIRRVDGCPECGMFCGYSWREGCRIK